MVEFNIKKLTIVVVVHLVIVFFKSIHGNCPDDWIAFMTSCYKFVFVNKMFYKASSWCRSEQSELASIGSEDENIFIASKLTTDTWIGLYKETCIMKADIYWLDGSNVSYTNFDPPDPDENTCCIRIIGRGWRDRGCKSEMPFVCERPIESKRNYSRLFSRKITSSYLDNQDIAVVEISDCRPLLCVLRCTEVPGCAGFNMRSISNSLKKVCICGLKGSESWLSFNFLEEDGAQFWTDVTLPKFYKIDNSTQI